MNILKQKTKLANQFYKSLTFAIASTVTSIVTSNKKLESTAQGQNYKVAGISLYPAFKNSCSNAGTCKALCIAFTGIGQIIKGSKEATLSNIDKAQLKRLWLLRNNENYFYKRAKNELEELTNFGSTLVQFREITSECLDMNFFDKIESVMTYGYFKNPKKINPDFENAPMLKLYSWSELSNAIELESCFNNNLPVALVVPKKLHKELLEAVNTSSNIVYHNGDLSDLESHNNFKTGKLNVHLLSEKQARFANVIERPKFLDSYKLFFECLELFKLKYS